MITPVKYVTLEEFESVAFAPENADKEYEFIHGEIIEVVSNPVSSKIAMRLGIFIGMYLLKHDIGHLTGADGGYEVGNERYIPDVGFISYEKQSELSYKDGYIPNAPDLAVELISPANSEKHIMIKVGHYIEAGTLVWIVYPQDKQVVVYGAEASVSIYKLEDILTGGHILPDFKLKVEDIFA